MNRRHLLASVVALPLLALPNGEPAVAKETYDGTFDALIDIWRDYAMEHVYEYVNRRENLFARRGTRYDFQFDVLVDTVTIPGATFLPNKEGIVSVANVTGPFYQVRVVFHGEPLWSFARPVRMQSMKVYTGLGLVDEYTYF